MISTFSTCSRFQTGSRKLFAKRRPRMFSTVALPRKWSTRWMWSSGTRPGKRLVQGAGRCLARAKRLLHHQPGPGRYLVAVQGFAGQLADAGRQGKVDGDGPFQLGQQSRQGAVGRDIKLMVSRWLLQSASVLSARRRRPSPRRGEGVVDPGLPLFRCPGIGAGPHQVQPVGRPFATSRARPGSSNRPVRSPEAPRMSRVFTVVWLVTLPACHLAGPSWYPR